MAYEILKKSMRSLASVCDYAIESDGQGFNGRDTQFGHVLADAKFWSKKMACIAYKFAILYQKQLLNFGIDVKDIKNPKTYKPKYEEESTLTIGEFTEKMMKIPPTEIYTKKGETKIVRAEDVFWGLWRSKKTQLKALGVGLKKDDKFTGFEWAVSLWLNKMEPIKEKPIIKEYDFSDTILYDYQKAHAIELVKGFQEHGVVADTSDCGTGKTFTAISICQKLNLKFLVVCPKGVIPSWRRSVSFVKAWDLCKGVVNYELIKTGKYLVYEKSLVKKLDKITMVKNYFLVERKVKCPYISVEKNPNKAKYEPKSLISWNIREDMVIIWDEAHRGKNKSINSQLMISATDDGVKQMLLTATLGTSPKKMFGTAKSLGLYNKAWEFYTHFLTNNGCRKEEVNRRTGATDWIYRGGVQGMKKIHDELGNKIHGMRADPLRKAGLFPNTIIYAENYNLNGNNKKVEKIYEEMFEKIREIHNIKESMKMDPEKYRLNILQKASQEVELLKVPLMVEMTRDYINSGHSVAIFVNYTDTLLAFTDALMRGKGDNKLMKTFTAIYGEISAKKKEENRLKFENNEERVIVCNMTASKEGIDLHDKHHQFKRISLVTPNYEAQVMKQVLGRIDRAGGTDTQQRIIYGMGTIEEKVCAIVKRKLKNISALNDGDTNPLNIFGGI